MSRESLSVGGWVICGLAIVSSAAVVTLPSSHRDGLEMWVFARPHYNLYEPVERQWNQRHEPDVHLYLLSLPALERRMLSGFLSDTPVADLIEVDVNAGSRAFRGPLDQVGFLDLTDRLEQEGIRAELNEASFSPWTSRGRVFGLPHDVHPVMLVYPPGGPGAAAHIVAVQQVRQRARAGRDHGAEGLRRCDRSLPGAGTAGARSPAAADCRGSGAFDFRGREFCTHFVLAALVLPPVLLLAGTLVSIAPVMALFLLLQREFISGLTSGAVNG